MSDRYKAILLFGAPGSGKGTQGKVIGAIPGFLHSSTGDIFRALDPNSEMGKTARSYSSRGLLVPDDFTINLWTQHMANLAKAGKFDPKNTILIMDGVPRNVPQAELLKDKIDVLKVIYLVAKDTNEMVKRLQGRALKEGRADDADEKVIRNRMDVYAKETEPVLNVYPQDKIARIDAVQSIIRVLGDIVKVLTPIKEEMEK
jgi:adenylate kinase